MQHQDKAMQIGAISPDTPGIEFPRFSSARPNFPTPPADSASPAGSGSGPEPQSPRSPCGASRPAPLPSPPRARQSSACPLGCRVALGALSVAAFRSAAVRRLVHSGRLVRRARRKVLQPRKLVLDRLMFRLQLRQSDVDLLIFPPQTPNLAHQIANDANQVCVR